MNSSESCWIGVDALAIVQLGEQLDIQRQRQHRPGALAKNSVGDRVVIDVETITGGQDIADHRVDEAEQRLMLQLLVAEPYQRLQRDLVAEPVILAQLQHLGIDEALDQTEDIGVGATLDLADEPLFIGRQGRESIRQRKPVGKKLLGGVEVSAPGSHPCRCPNEPAWTFECSVRTVRCCH